MTNECVEIKLLSPFLLLVVVDSMGLAFDDGWLACSSLNAWICVFIIITISDHVIRLVVISTLREAVISD